MLSADTDHGWTQLELQELCGWGSLTSESSFRLPCGGAMVAMYEHRMSKGLPPLRFRRPAQSLFGVSPFSLMGNHLTLATAYRASSISPSMVAITDSNLVLKERYGTLDAD